jgi:hypothetical protein
MADGGYPQTVRVTADIRTLDPEELVETLRKQGDNLGDHMVAVVLPAMGFEGKAQAGGSHIHQHEEDDRDCASMKSMPRMYRKDGQDEL